MSMITDHRGRPRVVITGMGALTPMGMDVAESWESVLTGRSGIRRVTRWDASEFPCQIGGEIPTFKATDYGLNRKEARRMGRASQFAVAALRMAQADAGLPETVADPERSGVMMGTAIGGFDRMENAIETYRKKGWTRVNPFALSSALPNIPSHHISLAANTVGPIGTQVTACAAGVQGVGEGAELIRRGSADLVFAGGVDALVEPSVFAGFCAMRAFPTNYNDAPDRASRPFDANREGFIISEGCAVLVLERLDHALERGARIYAEIIGQASSSDAHHLAAPDPQAEGAVRSMRWALQDAGIEPHEIDYINAHGTSTPLNDKGETLAVKKLLGEAAYNTPVSSTKSIMGHAMGASGAIESVFCAMVLHTGIIPPTWNYETPDPDCDLDYVPNAPRQANPTIAMSNAFGLGGQNASIVFRKFEGI